MPSPPAARKWSRWALRRADLSGKKDPFANILEFIDPEKISAPAQHQRRDERRGSRPPRAPRRRRRIAALGELEIIPDPRYLLPDPIETFKAAEILVKEGFTVLPYINADPVLAKRLQEVGLRDGDAARFRHRLESRHPNARPDQNNY